jgi:hypothetical protein
MPVKRILVVDDEVHLVEAIKIRFEHQVLLDKIKELLKG